MSASISSLIPELQPFARDLLDVAGAAGLQPRITSTLRTHQEQTRLYRRYLAGQNPYPVAPPGTSAHEFGYAFDMVVYGEASDLVDLGTVWKSWGGEWGGNQDPIHFQYPGFSAPKEQEAQSSGWGVTCDMSDWKNWVIFNPACAARVIDFMKGSWMASLLALGYPKSEILQLFSEPAETILKKVNELGL